MRNLSFALTTRQMRDRTKTVTRRRGDYWARVLKPGDLVCAVEKSQGIRKGGLVRLGVIRIMKVGVEQLREIQNERLDGALRVDGYWETRHEGFPGWTPESFVRMFCEHMKCKPDQTVTRIEFEFPTCVCDHPADHHDARALGCEFDPCPYVPAGGA